MGNFIKAPPREAAVVSGPKGTRIAVGQTAFQFWCIETTERLSLELLTIPLSSIEAETCKGVRVNVKSVAQLKVNAWMKGEDGNDALDRANIKIAAQHFLGSSETQVIDALRQTMEGHQRQILGTLTVEEIYKDRATFSAKVRDFTSEDLGAMGFKLVSYTVTQIDDTSGYMESLGATQTAIVKREAAEGRSKNEAQARKSVAEYEADAEIVSATQRREAHVSVSEQKAAEAQADRNLKVKKAEFLAQINEAESQAQNALSIEDAKQKQHIVREAMQQQVISAEIEVAVMEQSINKQKKEKEGRALAALLAQKNEAEGIRVLATANADSIRLAGEAEADIILKKGQAEASVLKEKALAYKQYGEAALVQLVVEKLPEIAEKIAAPLSKTDKMMFISTGGAGGASSFTNDMTNIIAAVPDVVQNLTGFDVKKALAGGTAPKDGQVAEV